MIRIISRGTALAVAGSMMMSSVAFAAQCTPVASPVVAGIGSVVTIGTATVPNDLEVDGTLVGGLSGIDYQPETGQWVAICDDRSEHAPARYYTLDLAYGEGGFTTHAVTGPVTLMQADGTPYPAADGSVPDPESIRFDPTSGALWYASEGSSELDINPFVAEANPDRSLVGSLPLPELFEISSPDELGPRDNLVFEGLTFAADGESLWVAMERPLYQDVAESTADQGTPTRITNLDRKGNVFSQYAFPVDPSPRNSNWVRHNRRDGNPGGGCHALPAHRARRH